MNIAEQIQKTIEKINEPHPFEAYRNILKNKKKLPRKEWMSLQKIVKTRSLYDILKMDLSSKEARILGNAMMSVSLPHVDDIIELIIYKDDINTPVLLASILNKRCKIDTSVVYSYLIKCIDSDIKLSHLNLLYVVYKNYTSLIDNKILDFCETNGHDICEEIISLRMKVE